MRWVLPATILGSSLGFIDGSVVNVALPAIRQGLNADFATAQWVVNGYMLTLAGLMLPGGSAGDRFGRKRMFLTGLVGFALASLACGLAPSATWLIAARVVQGAAAALLTPASLAIIGAAYSGDARGPAIGTWAAAASLTTALGPPLGGWLVEAIGWRSIFYINLPVAGLTLLLGSRLPADRVQADRKPLDVRGAVLVTAALGLLSYGLIALGDGQSRRGGLALALAALATIGFLVREARARAPMMPLSLFRDMTFSGANVLTVLLYAALSGALFLLPFMLIEAKGLGAAVAGAAFLPFSAIMGLGSRWAGGLATRVGARRLLTIGPAMTALGYLMLGLSADGTGYWTAVLPGLIVVAAGMTLSVPPLTTSVLDASPSAMTGIASGVNNVAARAGGLVAVAALGLALGTAAGGALPAEALMAAYRNTMLVAAVLAGASALVGAWTIGRAPLRVQPA